MSDNEEPAKPSWWERVMSQFTDKEPAEVLKEGKDWISERYDNFTHVKDVVDAERDGSLGDVLEKAPLGAKDFMPHERAKEDMDSFSKIGGGVGDSFSRAFDEVTSGEPTDPSEREAWLESLARSEINPLGYIAGGAARKLTELQERATSFIEEGKGHLNHAIESRTQMYHDARDAVQRQLTPADPEANPESDPSPTATGDQSFLMQTDQIETSQSGISTLSTDISEGDLGAAMNATGDEFSLQQMYAQMEQTMIEQGATPEDLAEFRSIEGQVTDMIDSSTINGDIDPDLFQQNMNSYLSENGIDPSSYDGEFSLSNPYGEFASTLGEQPTEDFTGSDSTGDDSDYDDFDDPPGTARAAL